MTLKVKLIHTTPLDAATFEKVNDLFTGDPQAGVIGLERYLNGYVNGARKGTLVCNVGEVSATGTLTLTGEPTAGSSFTVANITFTAGTGATTGSTFQIGTSVTQTASNIVASVGSNATASSIVTASSTAGTVKFTASAAGNSGNGIELATNLGSSSVSGFTGGTNGTSFTLTLTQ